MTLATHAVIGAALASTMPTHPVAGVCLAFASHFVLDALPHWDYHLRSSHEDKANPLNNDLTIGRDFYFDLIKIGFDGLLGLVVGYWLFHQPWGAIAAMFPDFLQFVYFKTRLTVVGWLQRFHMWIHTDRKIKNRPVFGIALQVFLVTWVLLAVYVRS